MKQLIAKKLIVSFIIAVIISGIAGMVGLILLNTLDKGYGEALVSNGLYRAILETITPTSTRVAHSCEMSSCLPMPLILKRHRQNWK